MASSKKTKQSQLKHGAQNTLTGKQPLEMDLVKPPDASLIEAATSNTCRNQRRNRTKFTNAQLNVLEATFERSYYPDLNTIDKLASLLDLNYERVSVWFQNRRARNKKLRKKETEHARPKGKADMSLEEAVKHYKAAKETATLEESEEYDGDANSLMSNQAPSEQSIDIGSRHKSLAEIKAEMLNADEDSQSSYTAPSFSISSYSATETSTAVQAQAQSYYEQNEYYVQYPQQTYMYNYHQESHDSPVPSIDSLFKNGQYGVYNTYSAYDQFYQTPGYSFGYQNYNFYPQSYDYPVAAKEEQQVYEQYTTLPSAILPSPVPSSDDVAPSPGDSSHVYSPAPSDRSVYS